MLLFKKRFLDAIRAGTKTQTIRVWKVRRMRTGQRSYIPGAGYIQVDSVEEISLDELSDEDAPPDGFDSLGQLRAELTELYGEELGRESRAYRVRFHVLPPRQQQELRAARAAKKQ